MHLSTDGLAENFNLKGSPKNSRRAFNKRASARKLKSVTRMENRSARRIFLASHDSASILYAVSMQGVFHSILTIFPIHVVKENRRITCLSIFSVHLCSLFLSSREFHFCCWEKHRKTASDVFILMVWVACGSLFQKTVGMEGVSSDAVHVEWNSLNIPSQLLLPDIKERIIKFPT
jgi:hypothetical protein